MNGLEGQSVGEFKLLTKVGQGGMGTIYLADQPALNRRVAVKVLLPDLAHDPQFPKRFKREAMLAASINHPGIVQIYAAGEVDDVHYLAMEYVDGESLQRRLEREGRLRIDDALSIIIRLAQALDYAWQKARLIHRDIKPSNVLISTDGEVKLADFGMARNADMDSSLTATGMPIGTPLYISPEQARCNRDLDFTTDIYSLGCTLYHLISGRAPYVAEASFAVMLLHITEPPPSIRDHMPDCPPAVVRVLNRMLAKDSHERHASYAELIEDLQAAKQEQEGGANDRPVFRPVMILAAIMIAALSAWHVLSRSERVSPLAKPAESLAAQNTGGESTAASDPSSANTGDLPAEAQVKRVLERLRELNPSFDAKSATYKIESNAVVEFAMSLKGVTNITPLRSLTSLRSLTLGRLEQIGALESLEALRGMQLNRLDCSYSPIRDLEPLRGMPLSWLTCPGSKIQDLSPLKGMALEALGINDTNLSDLTPLRGMPLKFINIGVSNVGDLAPLRGMELVEVNCSRTPINDLTPLAGMPLTRLVCKGTRVTDLSPIRGMPLREIDCDFVPDRDTGILRSIPTLQKINAVPAEEFWRKQ